MDEHRRPAFRQLLAYEIGTTADALRRSAAMRMRREHNVSLAQISALALIEQMEPVRLRDVAADAGADKAQISRVVTSLVSRGLVSRQVIVGDSRSAHLGLTDTGRAKFEGIFKTLQERDAVLRDGLQPGEIQSLIPLLERIRKSADRLSMEEERLADEQSSAG